MALIWLLELAGRFLASAERRFWVVLMLLARILKEFAWSPVVAAVTVTPGAAPVGVTVAAFSVTERRRGGKREREERRRWQWWWVGGGGGGGGGGRVLKRKGGVEEELVGRKNIEKFAYLRPILTNKMNNNLHFPPLHIMNALSIDTLPLIEFHTQKK